MGVAVVDDPRSEARKRGLISGALHRGEVWPVGTRVKWSRTSKVVYVIDDTRVVGRAPHEAFHVHLTPEGGVRRGVTAFWTSVDQLVREES